jgi:hypothetical protein
LPRDWRSSRWRGWRCVTAADRRRNSAARRSRSHLGRRLGALHLPAASDAAFHIHVRLRIFVGSRQVPVPAGIGIDPAGGPLASLHTHDASGIVHVEADRPFPFTLGQFFSVWGVRLSRAHLGGYGAPSVFRERPARARPGGGRSARARPDRGRRRSAGLIPGA